MEPIKRLVRVVIEKEIEVELTPGVFGGMSLPQYLAEFSNSLWNVDGIDDVVMYAARVAATNGEGYHHDGLGLVGQYFSTYPRVPDVKFREISAEFETEVLKRPNEQAR